MLYCNRGQYRHVLHSIQISKLCIIHICVMIREELGFKPQRFIIIVLEVRVTFVYIFFQFTYRILKKITHIGLVTRPHRKYIYTYIRIYFSQQFPNDPSIIFPKKICLHTIYRNTLTIITSSV